MCVCARACVCVCACVHTRVWCTAYVRVQCACVFVRTTYIRTYMLGCVSACHGVVPALCALPVQVVQWDLAVEKDFSEAQTAEDSLKVPPQLLFIHQVSALDSTLQPWAVSSGVMCCADLTNRCL